MHRRIRIPGCAAAQVCRCKAAVNLADLTLNNLQIGEMLDVTTANNDSFGWRTDMACLLILPE